ncbi:MAG: hypothetical protein L0I76_10285 [Pseudonocardia sp.]|nr:hypothetical protein [Pseudonocardia sp.]
MTRPDYLPTSTVSVNLHVYETTPVQTVAYPNEDRVTVAASGSGGSVTLYLNRPDIARLRRVLEQAEHELTERQRASEVRSIRGPAA